MRVTVGRVGAPCPRGVRAERVSRGTPLGNPFKMGREGDRTAVCDAYSELVALGASGPDRDETLVNLGRKHGFHGAVVGWDGRAADARIDALAAEVRGGKRLRLDCHCAPRRCHAQAVAREVTARASLPVGGEPDWSDGEMWAGLPEL